MGQVVSTVQRMDGPPATPARLESKYFDWHAFEHFEPQHWPCHMVQPIDRSHQLQHEHIAECLRDKTVLVSGNSVGRHWAFVLRRVLDNLATPTDRLDNHCGRESRDGQQQKLTLCSVGQADGNRTQEKLLCGSGKGFPNVKSACNLKGGLNTSHDHLIYHANVNRRLAGDP
eukprot:1268744-Prymnesium_polylepis.1